MNDTPSLSFEILVDRGVTPAERLVIHHPRVLVGGGAHCDIRVDGADRVHVELELEGEHVMARGRSSTPAPTIGGVPLVATRIEPGTMIDLPGARITVGVLRKAKGTGRSPAWRFFRTLGIALLAVTLPATVYAALEPSGEAPIGPAPKHVALWDDTQVVCKVQASDQAGHVARQMRAAGRAKQERYPFAVQDGVAAYAALQMAAACHRAANTPWMAQIDEDDSRRVRRVVESDYTAHRVRLQRAIETEDVPAALREVKTLRKLTANANGPYVDWLAMVERRLDLAMRDHKSSSIF